MKYRSIPIGLIVSAASTWASAAQLAAQTVFDQLKKLEGSWQSTKGKTSVDYALMAKGSTIVETWTMSPTCEVWLRSSFVALRMATEKRIWTFALILNGNFEGVL